jgi:hypothetical protein
LGLAVVPVAGPAAADETPTPGIWINPELGLATPEDAAVRYKAPFHTWLVDHWKEPKEPDWRRRIFFRFLSDSRDGGPLLSRKAASCAVMRTAYGNPSSGFDPNIDEPHSLLNWKRGLTLLDECLALKYLARLKPLAPGAQNGPGFLARRRTAQRISPLLLTHFTEHICRAVDAERAGVPGLHNRQRLWEPNFHREAISEWAPWTERPTATWSIWPEREMAETFQGLRFHPRIILERPELRYTFEVWGIGALDEDPRPHLVVLAEVKAKGRWWSGTYPDAFAGILVYDPEQDLFRATNLEDFMIRNWREPKECRYELDLGGGG